MYKRQPYNATGNATGCPEISFTTILLPPECTQLITPAHQSSDVDTSTNLVWEAVDNAAGYFISVGTIEDESSIIDFLDVGNVTEYVFPNELPEGRNIFVTIIPYNSEGMGEDCFVSQFLTAGLSLQDQDNGQKFGFSPDGDGINEFWEIKEITNYPNNVVSIYNRWGELVFEISGYDNAANAFRGSANRGTNRGAGELPEGTYFFTIDIPVAHSLIKRGYLVLKR